MLNHKKLCYKISVQKSNKDASGRSEIHHWCQLCGVFVCVCHCECVRLVRARSLSASARLVSLCH